MDYRLTPYSSVWNDGIFNVPSLLVDKYLKMTSEYQLKALLFILRNGGCSSSDEIAASLGISGNEAENILEYWLIEGVLVCDNSALPVSTQAKEENVKQKNTVQKETLSAPRLSPKDIVDITRNDDNFQILLSQAQVVLGRTISHAEQEMLVNMVNYYGLKVEIILMILEYYRSEKEKGKAIGISYINTMAKNWADDGIETISQAEEKLQFIARSDRLWNEIKAITGVVHRRPTQKQRLMVEEWFNDFDVTMISLASDIMKENLPEPRLSYINSILKKWKKQDVKTPEQAKLQQIKFEKQKENKNDGRLKGTPSYDLEQIKRNAMNNTEI